MRLELFTAFLGKTSSSKVGSAISWYSSLEILDLANCVCRVLGWRDEDWRYYIITKSAFKKNSWIVMNYLKRKIVTIQLHDHYRQLTLL
jgi:hypothetical protein